MKKLLGIIIGIFITVASIFTPFMGNTNYVSPTLFVSAEEQMSEEQKLEQILSGASITQAGYVFKKSDFLIRTIKYDSIAQENVYCLYVNTSITITNTSKTSNLLVSHQISSATISGSEQLYENQYINITFDTTKECTQLVTMSKTIGSQKPITFKFYLIQTPVLFNSSNSYYYWTNHMAETVLAPTSSFQYSQLNLLLNDNVGTDNSPLFIDFYYNGEFYSLYKIGTTIYNQITGNKIQNNAILFNIPGKYEVYIYDLTCTRAIKTEKVTLNDLNETKNIVKFIRSEITYSPYGNCNNFTFSITASTDSSNNVYLIASNTLTRDTVVNGQVVNNSVNIQFYNLTATDIKKIEVEKSHTYIRGDNVTTTEILYDKSVSAPYNNDIKILNTQSLKYAADNTYTIKVYFNDSTIQPYIFEFTILSEIHSSYGDISSIDQEPNITKLVEQEEAIFTSYDSIKEIVGDSTQSLKSSMTNKYTVKIARANCSIDGIADGASTQDEVTLTIHGVGTITTKVYRDDVLVDTIYLSNGRTYTVTDAGKYKIVTTDELNTTIYKTFTITQEISASTVILIGVGVIGLLLFIILVTRTRTKIKVR